MRRSDQTTEGPPAPGSVTGWRRDLIGPRKVLPRQEVSPGGEEIRSDHGGSSYTRLPPRKAARTRHPIWNLEFPQSLKVRSRALIL